MNSVRAASWPWAFTQQHPLDTDGFIKEADRRGWRLDNELLRELWRVGVLAPFCEIRNEPVGRGSHVTVPEPSGGSSWLMHLRNARQSGRLADPVDLGFRHQVRLESPTNASRYWWNGLIYSRWQLLAVDRFRRLVTAPPRRQKQGRRVVRLPTLDEYELVSAKRLRRLATLLVAIEARYLPVVEPRHLHLVNCDQEEWDRFREQFDPMQILNELEWQPDQVVEAADRLLGGLWQRNHLGSRWQQLINRASRRSWDDLSGEPLAVLDVRLAAELLLLLYGDLAERGQASSLDSQRGNRWNHERERLGYRDESLDASLSGLGLSPHPGAIIVVEGETEELVVPRVRDRLRIPDSAELIRMVVMRGTTNDLTKLVAFAAGPLVERRQGDHWLLVKPPTRILVAVDPDNPFHTDESTERQRQKMLAEIRAVVRAQGVSPNPDDLDDLVKIVRWSESCFEFAHFSDDELAAALLAIHPDCGTLDLDGLTKSIANARASRSDIKRVWLAWRPIPNKLALAEYLWPNLAAKIDAAMMSATAPIPEVAMRVLDTYHEAAKKLPGRYLLQGSPLGPEAE